MFSEPFKLQNKILFSHGRKLKLDSPILMGILNCSLDSFYDGSKYINFKESLKRYKKIIDDGADCIDIGGESSGPSSSSVNLDEELNRIIPLIKAIRKESNIWISVDTSKAEVARQSIEEGADIINDVTAMRFDPKMSSVISKYNVPIVLMYSKDDTPRTSKKKIEYEDVMKTIKNFFSERLRFAESEGIDKKQIILDPGMGFFISKKEKYSFEVIARISELHEFGLPLLLGPSKKSFLSKFSKKNALDFAERDIPCSVVSCIALLQGVTILRYHEVYQGRQLIDTLKFIQSKKS
tara:strand:+ start:1977 stop:2861 length:885 start_codon:yes stop_codon:yes gene_type:complete